MTTDIDGAERRIPALAFDPVHDKFEIAVFRGQRPHAFKLSIGLAHALQKAIAEADVVHIHSLFVFPTVVAAHIARRRRTPYVVRPHGTLNPYHRAHHRVRKAIYTTLVEARNLENARAMHYTSVAEQRHAEDWGIRTPGFVIPPGIDAEDYGRPTARSVVDGVLPALTEQNYVVAIGRISKKKGIDIVIRALGELRTRRRISLVVAGPDDEHLTSNLIALARAVGVADRVLFLDMVSGQVKRALLQHSLAFVLPSADENFAVAALEAMAAGTVVILTPEVALAQEVTRFECGVVVSRDAASVASAIEALVRDPQQRERIARRARACAASNFSWEANASRLEEMYRAIIPSSAAQA